MRKFDKVLAIHCHTSGMAFKGDDITLNHQALTIALAVVDMTTLKITTSTVVKVPFDTSKYAWDDKLVAIHGITKAEAVDDELNLSDAAAALGEFLYENFGINNSIPLMGYNPISFHLPFLNKVLMSEQLKFRFDNRAVDLFPVMALLGTYSVSEMFDVFEVDQSEPLPSLTIVKAYLKVFKTVKSIIKEII